jgi:arginine decarboxylase
MITSTSRPPDPADPRDPADPLITPAALAALREVAADGGRIAYAADPTLATFQVVAS